LVAGQSLKHGVDALARTSGDDSQTLLTTALGWIEDWANKGFFAEIELGVRESENKLKFVEAP